MIIRPFDESEERKKEVRLRVVREGPECGVMAAVYLAAVDERGVPLEGGLLVEISSSGLRLVGNVDKNIGLPLDGNGRVKQY